MKRNHIYTIGVLLVFAMLIGACSKKEREPTLIIHVEEADGTKAVSAYVHAWPGPDAGQSGSTINDALMDKETSTNEAGEAHFIFKFSAVLDVDVVYYKQTLDTLLNPVTDTLYGHRVVKIETVRQSGSENDYHETVVVK